jgi:hypothetical protein
MEKNFTRNIEVRRDCKNNVKSVIINKIYEIKKDGKVYDIHYANKEVKNYPKWLDEPTMKKLIKHLWNN